MKERKEYTGRLKINLEVTLAAKSNKEALELLLFPGYRDWERYG